MTAARHAAATATQERGAAEGRAGGAAALDQVSKSYARRTDETVELLERVGIAVGCSRPLRMVNEVGETIEVRCGTRRAADCPSCSALYRGDVSALLRSGVLDHGGIVVMLTLTAPSFGRVHRVPKPASPRLADRHRAAWVKRARRRCPCGMIHRPGDDLAGVPLDADRYDVAAQVRWNRRTGVLWNRTATRLTRALGLDGRLPYALVAEPQARGAMHFHGLLRVPDEATLGIYRDSAGRRRSRRIELAVAAAETVVDGEVMRWGSQVIAEVITTSDGRHARRSIGYLSKSLTYMVKDLAGAETPRRARHLRRVEAIARRTRCVSCPATGSCRTRCHRELGYPGWATRRSRTFTPLSLTLLRQRRIVWHVSDRDADVCSWRMIGFGDTSVHDELAAYERLANPPGSRA
ncbi:replication initiator [Blastococcus sp. Marseille-P5729]|uniref:replication initiator n=1 Tax=Blastococcus sp. Marseille-P5729 TaxID=2086582 RepID=UPI00131EBA7C|nr:replication initiator [Blastococcus sp. Marseille-P5729]